MHYLNLAKDWIMARWAERTSWDGGMLIALGVIAFWWFRSNRTRNAS